jgi:hypothetical protein
MLRDLTREQVEAEMRVLAAARCSLPRRLPPYPPPDARVREGDVGRGLWLLEEAREELHAHRVTLRRQRLVSRERADSLGLRILAERVEAAALDLAAAVAPDEDTLERAVSAMGADVLRAVEDAADALAEADRIAGERDTDESDELALRVLFNHPHDVRGTKRRPMVLAIAGHLTAMGVRPGVSLGLLESWDRDRCRPPLGGEVCEELLRYCARKQAERLEGVSE